MRLFGRHTQTKKEEPAVSGSLPEMSFPESFRSAVLDSTKLIASRPSRFGEVGSRFTAFDSEFVLMDIKELALGLVAKYLYRAEGYQSEEDFIDAWTHQYPGIGYHPDQIIYVHLFTKATSRKGD